jgi:DNA invertase Pin-like site-specific DNA recombinase
MVTLLALFVEIERDFISLRTKEALATKKAAIVILGKPKGTIQKSRVTVQVRSTGRDQIRMPGIVLVSASHL